MTTPYRILSDATSTTSEDLSRIQQMDTLKMSDLPQSERESNKCFNFKYRFYVILYIFISLMPFIKLIVDIWTIVIYLSYKNNSETNPSSKYSIFNNIHMIGLLSFILLLFSTRSYVVLFCGTMDNRAIMMDNDITKNLYRIIPFIGALFAELIHEKYWFSFSVLAFCQYFCFELGSLIGIIFAPWCMIYVFVRSYKINKKYIFVELSDIGNDKKYGNTNRKSTGYGRSASSLQLFYKSQAFVNEKLEKYQVQLLLLKFSDCFFHGMPQMAIQIYVYTMNKPHIYDNQLNVIIFYLSMITSIVAIFQFFYECICNTRKTHLIEIFN